VPKGRVKLISSKMVYQGKVFGVRHDVVVEPGGKPAGRDIVTHPGSVVVLPVLNDGRILMIRQYRQTAGDYMLEVVAGRKESGENNLKAAKRELAEETGYRAKRFREMMDVYPSPGFVEETMVAFAATGLTAGKTNFDYSESPPRNDPQRPAPRRQVRRVYPLLRAFYREVLKKDLGRLTFDTN
jgi:ADP-ribose pyrophosphatase